MASTYTTGFGIEKIGSGEQAGSWGTTTNHNADILDRIASYKAVALSGTTHTLTVREASPGSGTENLQDGMYRVIKFTGALGGNNTVTIAPNTSPAWFIVENATTDSGSSGPYTVILTQGSGANVTVQNGKNAIVYCDGAGSGAVVYDALADIQVGTLEVTGVAAIDGALTQGGASQFNSTITVGVDDTGYDVKMFGAASGSYLLWDESADDLILAGAAGLSVAGTTATAAITASGIIKTDDTTAATSTTDGSLQTDGGLSVVLDAVIGDDLFMLSDGAVITFGADKDVTLTHVADSGLALKHSATADDKPINLVLQTGETDIAANDVIGKISFQAPDEAAGTDAILISGAIQARSEGDFSASSNATSLDFMTGASAAATTKLTLASDGDLTMPNVTSSTQTAFRPPYIDFQIASDNPSGVNKGLYWHSVTASTNNRTYGALWRDQSSGNFHIDSQTDIVFSTTTSSTERMRITSAGLVGIGVSPSHSLQVAAGADTDAMYLDVNGNFFITDGNVQITNPSGADQAALSVTQSHTSANAVYASGPVEVEANGAGTGSGAKDKIILQGVAGNVNPNGAIEYWGSNSASGAKWGMYTNAVTSADFVLAFAAASGSYASVFEAQTDLSVDFKGAVNVAGALSKASGSFKIAHPLPAKKDTHHLVHSFIEGPQADLIYRGRATLAGGTVAVNIDTAAGMTEGTFEVLCGDVQCFTSNEEGWTALKGSVTGNILAVTAQDDSCTDTISWMVIGERKDPHMLETDWTDEDGKVIVEPLKVEEVVKG
jgi:hypothetical protein